MSFGELASRTGPAVLQAPGQMKSVPSSVAATSELQAGIFGWAVRGLLDPLPVAAQLYVCIFQQARFSAFIIFKGIHES